MDIVHNLMILSIAALSGAVMGSYLLLTLLYQPLKSSRLTVTEKLDIYRRYYRLGTVLCLIAGLIAALTRYPHIALILAVVAISFVFANMHILKGLAPHPSLTGAENQRLHTSLVWLQNLTHLAQFLAIGYVVYLLR